MRKAIVFDPYMDTLGGGERYCLTVAEDLSALGFAVDIAWPDDHILVDAAARFGMSLKNIQVNKQAYSVFTLPNNLLNRLIFTRKYHLAFWLSDGSLPLLGAKQTLIHFQVPFAHLKLSLSDKIKLLFIDQIIYNSGFTQHILEKTFPRSKGRILYPPVSINQFAPLTKAKTIISVGRFDSPSHNKRQDIIIKAFSLLYRNHPDFKLTIVGGLMGSQSVISDLRTMALGLPVEFIINPNFPQLQKLYGESSFFWHAAGYGIDAKVEPEKVEHFGITTVEAMTAGCVPVVIDRGGQKEIIVHGQNGFLCENESEMSLLTSQVIDDQSLYRRLQQAAIITTHKYSRKSFSDKLNQLINHNLTSEN